MKLEFTRKDVEQWLTKFGKNNNSAIVCAFRDWLAMDDLIDELLSHDLSYDKLEQYRKEFSELKARDDNK